MEKELADIHAGLDGDGYFPDVAQLQREASLETWVYSGRGGDDESAPPPTRFTSHVCGANADIINRGLAEVGITALVDEATGFQDVRAKDALAKILERFVAKEIQPYLTTFPLDFFRELCRLRGMPFPENMRLPPYFGKLVNGLIYCRLAPGVLAELQRKNPVSENGRRKNKNYKWLTPTVGHPKLLQLLGSEVTLMRMSETYDEFETLVNKYHQPYKPLPLFDWAERQKDADQD